MLRRARQATERVVLVTARRYVATTTEGLKGNGVIGIRREDKNEWERRVPLTPKHVSKLVSDGLQVLVQPSSIRAFSDAEYVEAGAVIAEDLSPASTIVAVKEVPVHLLIPEKTYMMFSHTHKAQPYNMPLLDAILKNRIRLIDFERIAGANGRCVKFGPFAGFAGMIDTLHALGLALLAKKYATPFLHISHAKEYRSLESARTDLIELGNLIRSRGLPRELGPLTFVFTGAGSVSQAAQQILHHLPCQYVEAGALEKLSSNPDFDNKTVYVTMLTSKDMVRHKEPSKKFDKQEYYEHPERFVPVFHEEVAPYAKVVVNGMYWEEKFPRLLTTEQARRLAKEDRFPLLVLGEITCDPYGSIEFFTKSTSIAHPLYCYDPRADEAVDFEEFRGQGPLIVGVDHLPAEFPVEASEFFGDPLVPFAKAVAQSDGSLPLEVQKTTLPEEVYRGVIANNGSLTPDYAYIDDLRRSREVEKQGRQGRHILFLGAGMVSGPAVEHLLQDPRNSVTLADANLSAAEAVLEEWAGDHYHAGRDAAGRVQSARAVPLDVSDTSHLESLVQQADVVISLVPWTMHPKVMEVCIRNKVNVVTASYVSPGVQTLHDDAEKAGVTILNEMGLDPGIDIMSSLQLLEKIRQEGGVVRAYESYCGALPEPEASRNCLGYKFSWSPKGVLLAAQRPCTFKWKGNLIDLEGRRLYDVAQPFTPFRGLHMEWVPNGNALGYEDIYGLHDAHTIVRATLRFTGFSTVVRGMRELGLLEPEARVDELQQGASVASWSTVLGRLAGVSVQDLPQFLADRFASVKRDDLAGFFDSSAVRPVESEVSEALAGLRELRLLDEAQLAPQVSSGLVIDSLAESLNKALAFEPHERDFVLMYHRIVAEFPRDGVSREYEMSLAQRGTENVSATAKTVGLPVAIGAQLVLDGTISTTGVVRPITRDVYNPVMRELSKCGIRMRETEKVTKI